MNEVTAIFDIGKTNKKFFLFDRDYQEIYREYIRIDEINDEDGYPTENLAALEKWVKTVFHRMMDAPEFDIISLNFSCYGASLVHIDAYGNVLTPLYSYMKPLNAEIYDAFYGQYGPEYEFSRITGSPKLGMLNTGMHLFWLKNTQPEIFGKIKYSLHLPQYLSYLFTGVPRSEYTSIGCHSMLWDYEKNTYHDWVFQEGIDTLLPPIIGMHETIPIIYKAKTVTIGAGIHDSSAALLPYILNISDPFLLVSTGTWSISINPFPKGMLTLGDIRNQSLFNMRIDGSPVKVSRLFLGNEYRLQVKMLAAHFKVPDEFHKTVKFDQGTFLAIRKNFKRMFKWISITAENAPDRTHVPYDRFEDAYHQLMIELVLLQVESIKRAVGNDKIEKIFVDGGFSDNDVYIKLVSHYLDNMELRTADSSLGSALGAAIAVVDRKLNPNFLKKNYALKLHPPTIPIPDP